MGEAELEQLLPHVPKDAWQRVRASGDALADEQQARTLPCPLLSPEDGGCTVYPHRPLMCVVYHSLSPASWCWPELAGERQLAHIVQPMALVVAMHVLDTREGRRVAMLGSWLAERAASAAR